MAKSDHWRPRLNLDITEEQYFKLQKIFPWGVKQEFFRLVIDDIIDLIERKGERAIAAVLTKSLQFKEVSKTLKDLEEELIDERPKEPSS